ncbi:hypothetical protein CL634_10070 [bacterium]|nr:hypothetical protein [bacterium]
MHYIIGAQFTVPVHNTAKPTSGVTQLTPQASQAPVKEFKNFKPNSVYTVYNIQRANEMTQYTFNGSTGDTVVIEFTDAHQADEFIANCRREPLPDYSKFYENRKD